MTKKVLTMTINLVQFTPFLSFLGGVLIGCATWILLLFCGRIAGISGILGGVLSRGTPDRGWRLAFLVGIIISPFCMLLSTRFLRSRFLPPGLS